MALSKESNVRTLRILERHPSLKDFCTKMDVLVEKYVQEALDGQENGTALIPFTEIEDQADRELFSEMLSERPEFDGVDVTQNEVYLTIAQDFRKGQDPCQTMS